MSALAARAAVPIGTTVMVAVPIAIVVAMAMVAIWQDYRFMTALESAQPELYREYGGHAIRPTPPRFRMMSAVLTGRYKAEVTDPRARVLAGQLRAAMLLFFAVLAASLVYVAAMTGVET